MLELTTQNFQREVLESGKPTLVYFYSPVGCAPCKLLTPVVEKLDAEWSGSVKVAKLNIYPNMPLTLKYIVMTAPVLLLFIHGEPVVRLQGYSPREKILSEMNPHLQKI
jgi:thioredoxin 1